MLDTWKNVEHPRGWIYAAQEEGAPLVKIGCTASPRNRDQSLRWHYRTSMAIVAAVYVQKDLFTIERRVHALLAAERIEREWFYLHMSQRTLERVVTQAVSDIAARRRREDEQFLQRQPQRRGPYLGKQRG
jgi:hypothetical protein